MNADGNLSHEACCWREHGLDCAGRAERRRRFRAGGWLASKRKFAGGRKAAWRFASRRSPRSARLCDAPTAFICVHLRL